MPADRSMPAFVKADPGLVEHFRAVMAEYPEAPVRNTFGSPCAYVNGNMAVGLHRTGWFVRLDAAGTQALTDAGGGVFMPMPGRPMTGFTMLPQSIVSDDAQLRAWIERSLAHVASMPPKEAGRKKAQA